MTLAETFSMSKETYKFSKEKKKKSNVLHSPNDRNNNELTIWLSLESRMGKSVVALDADLGTRAHAAIHFFSIYNNK